MKFSEIGFGVNLGEELPELFLISFLTSKGEGGWIGYYVWFLPHRALNAKGTEMAGGDNCFPNTPFILFRQLQVIWLLGLF